jgi:hypothetical protein
LRIKTHVGKSFLSYIILTVKIVEIIFPSRILALEEIQK